MIIIPTAAPTGRNILAQGKRRCSISRATLGRNGAERHPKLDGSPRFGEPLSPPQTARRDCRIIFINQPLPRVARR
ncbi:MAG: hypothetical protein LBP75_03175 [Planctomycetota bacterium]|nr:hypothetical protein [Planctomycetota bacterium]